jgi:uncharacterized membrane protein YhaH (DUF805 family)
MNVALVQDSPPIDFRGAPERPGVGSGDGLLMLWIGMLAPPLLALTNLELSYALTPWACRTGDRVLMNIVTAILLVAVVLPGIALVRRLHHDWLEDTVISRPGFMAMLGVLESALFTGVIIAQWMPNLYLSACQ